MLFFLTGDIQTGKTRWLMQQIVELEAEGVEVCGVMAPGTWIDHGENTGGERFEKTGIDNLLLPERRTVPFARRADLADDAGAGDSQSARAGLGWAIDDRAIEEVNAHFARLAQIEAPGERLLVIDEFGRLELECGGGLTEAVALVDRGATPAFPHALVVVRAALLDAALERFANADWGGTRAIRPSNDLHLEQEIR